MAMLAMPAIAPARRNSMIDREQLTRTLADLVRIESVNPQLVPGGRGEAEIARYVVDFLAKAGFETRLQQAGSGRFNAIGVLRGRGCGRALMLNGHLDTVGVAGMEEPFAARMEGDRLFGRGAQDMKGGLAAALAAGAALAQESKLSGDLIIAGVADEEFQSLGTRALLEEGVKADAAIVMEPTSLEVAIAHKGFAWASIETLGRAAHGSRPEEGLDSIVFMGRVLKEIERLEEQLNARSTHPLLGFGSVHASLISGGQELSSYPERCRLDLERRLLPGEDGATFDREVSEILARLSHQDPQFQASHKLGYWAEPLQTPKESPIALTLAESVQKVTGEGARFGAQSFWTDAALLSRAGIPSVLFGPGGAGLHSAVEYVSLEDVGQCAQILLECAQAFCGLA
jgi:acetylornithine deacetylase